MRRAGGGVGGLFSSTLPFLVHNGVFRVPLYGTECAFVIFVIAIRRVIGGCHRELYGRSYDCPAWLSSPRQPNCHIVETKGDD